MVPDSVGTMTPATTCAPLTDPWARPARLIALDYGGTVAASGYAPLWPHAATVIRQLSERWRIPIILASNTLGGQFRLDSLREAGVDHCVTRVLESHVCGVAKPDPRFYRLLLEWAGQILPGIAPDAIAYVGDEAGRDVIGPVQHGMRAVWVTAKPDDDRVLAIPEVRVIADITGLPGALGLDS